MGNQKAMLVNNTGVDVRDFEAALFASINTGAELPEEIADIFTLRTFEVNGQRRGVVEFA